jgi:hypothetical protein
MFQPEAELLIVVKRGPNTQDMPGSSPRALFENPYFLVADNPPGTARCFLSDIQNLKVWKQEGPYFVLSEPS